MTSITNHPKIVRVFGQEIAVALYDKLVVVTCGQDDSGTYCQWKNDHVFNPDRTEVMIGLPYDHEFSPTRNFSRRTWIPFETVPEAQGTCENLFDPAQIQLIVGTPGNYYTVRLVNQRLATSQAIPKTHDGLPVVAWRGYDGSNPYRTGAWQMVPTVDKSE